MKNPLPAPVVRVLSALALATVLFQSGREVGRLETLAEGNTPAVAAIAAAPSPFAPPAESQPAAAVGNPLGTEGDLITPLNVRDPSALVMGPGASSYNACPPPPSFVPLPPDVEPVKPRKARKAKPLAEGRLLELLKKKDSTKELDVPKSY